MSPTQSTVNDAILDAVNGGLIVIDKNERIVRWNAWMSAVSGLGLTAVLGKTLSEVFSTIDLKRLNSAVKVAFTLKAPTILTRALNTSPLPLLTRAGQPLLHDITVSPAGEGDALSCLIFITDVTMATRREQYLREQLKSQYDAVVQSASDVIISIDSDGFIQLANPATISHFGYALAELIGMPAADLFDPQSGWEQIWRSAIDGTFSIRSKELLTVRRNGSLSYMEASASRWNLGAHPVLTVILRDIDHRRTLDFALRASELAARTSAEALADLNQTLEQRVEDRTSQLMQAEEALRQSHKMEAIGQLTGGIAHDFNNLLQGITGSLHVIQKLIAAGRIGEIDRFVVGARESANRAASLTHRLLAFSRQQPIDPRPVDLNQLITSIQELVRRTIGETIKMTLIPSDALWLVRCDENQLENAILNLAINARDAMPNGGTITFETANKSLSNQEARARELTPGDYVCFSITDSGEGIPPEIQARVFEPFFTTKGIGKGTGLGLSMIYGFVKQSGGSIHIDSEVGKGTTIHILLPRYHGELEETHVEEDTGLHKQSSGDVVLVVEDEGVVRLLVVDVLKELGYYALEADSGSTAMRILDSPQRIDLLIADLGLPDVSGRQIADAAIATRKDLKVLLMTGYAEKAASSSFLEGGMEIITKPFSMDTLALRIRAMIEGR